MEGALKLSTDQPLPVALPTLAVTPTPMQIFMFSAVTWNRHHIHYNHDAAVSEGLDDVVVQRALIGNFLARLLTHWIGVDGEIRNLSWRVTRSALPHRTLCCKGEVVAIEDVGLERVLVCELAVLDDTGATVAIGSARVVRLAGAQDSPRISATSRRSGVHETGLQPVAEATETA